MDEDRDENNDELKSQVSDEVKVDSSVVSPVIGQSDVTELLHSSDPERRLSHNNDEYESLDPVHSRHLDSVYQYTNKIRQFIGLVEPNEDKPDPVHLPEIKIENNNLNDANNQNLNKNDKDKKTFPDLNQDEDDAACSKPEVDDEKLIDLKKHNNDPALTISEVNDKKLTDLNPHKNNTALTAAGVENESENPSSSNNNEENEVKRSLRTALEETEKPKVDNSVSNETSVINELLGKDKQKNEDLLKTIDEILTEDANVIVPDAEAAENQTELVEVSGIEKDSVMSTHNSPLLESVDNKVCGSGVDLNKMEDLLNDEENKQENETCSDSNISTVRNQEQIGVNSEENKNSNLIEDPNKLSNEDRKNTSSNEDSNLAEENVTSNSSNELYAISEEKDSCVPSKEIKQVPHFEDIRRLSVEIVSKVIDTAGTQLRDILNDQRKSNADANNLVERSSNSENASFSHEETVKAANLESVDALHVEDKNNLKMNVGDSSQSSEEPEVRHKLNNEIQLKEVLAKTYDFNDFQKKIEVEMNKFDPKYDVDPDIVCGIGFFKPRWIQPWATSRVYLILYSIIGILSGSYYSYLIGAMSTLEKRFAFKSKTSGFVMLLDEITPLFLGIFVGYFGGKSHRPRIIGLGMLLSAICCFISALPYFIYGPATHLSLGYSKVDNEKKLELCNTDAREGFCEEEDRLPTITPLLLLMLGSFLKGFGNLSYYAVGLAYMDDNAKKKNTPMYFAIAFSLRLLGPVVGFLMSSFFLKYYENPFVDPGFSTSDPRWIGCWWMGFLVQGVLLLIFTVPISLFPRKLPGTVDYSKSDEAKHLATSFVGLFAALKRLAKNPVFCLIVLNTIMGIYGSFGHYIMLPRYMENQFRLSASSSSLISGPPSLGAVMISMTVGGYLIWKFKPGAKFLAGALCASEMLQVCAYLILMIPTCDRVEMTSYGFNTEGLMLQNDCNNNCNCTTSAFSPVCGPDGATMFFSPCHAGCSEKVNGTYSNCSCVFDSSGQQRDYVTDGFCVSENCWPSIIAYICTMPCIQLVVNLSKVGFTLIFLRSIKPEDKSVALGTFETFICLFGFIPYPVVYGALVDSACLIWEKSCGETGNCWYYDVPRLNHVLHGTSALFSTFDALTLLAIFFLASRVRELYKEDNEIENKLHTQKNEAEPQGERKNSSSSTKL